MSSLSPTLCLHRIPLPRQEPVHLRGNKRTRLLPPRPRPLLLRSRTTDLFRLRRPREEREEDLQTSQRERTRRQQERTKGSTTDCWRSSTISQSEREEDRMQAECGWKTRVKLASSPSSLCFPRTVSPAGSLPVEVSSSQNEGRRTLNLSSLE